MPLIDIPTLLPFLFILAVVYGALEFSDVFKNRGVKVIIAVVLAFFAASSAEAIVFINFILPYAAFFFVAFFFLAFVLSFFKGDKKGEKDYIPLIVILALIVIFLGSSEGLNIINIQDQNFLGMIVLLVIALLLYAGYKMGKNDK